MNKKYAGLQQEDMDRPVMVETMTREEVIASRDCDPTATELSDDTVGLKYTFKGGIQVITRYRSGDFHSVDEVRAMDLKYAVRAAKHNLYKLQAEENQNIRRAVAS